MNEKILLWKGSIRKNIDRKKLEMLLLRELAKQDFYKSFWEYWGNFNCIFENIDKIKTIQIYQDEVIRIVLAAKECTQSQKSIFIENKQITRKIIPVIEEIISC